MHTCDHCNCPKCLVQRAGRGNPAVQAALQQAWADETSAWGLPSTDGHRQYLAEYADEEYPADFYGAGNVPMQRAYNDPANPLNYGVDRYPRRAKAPILGLIPRRKPASPIEWFTVGMLGAIVLSIIGVIAWIGYQIKLMFDDTGAYLAAHGTQIFSGIVVIAALWALVALCSGGGGGGKGFSGTFTGRMH